MGKIFTGKKGLCPGQCLFKTGMKVEHGSTLLQVLLLVHILLLTWSSLILVIDKLQLKGGFDFCMTFVVPQPSSR